MDRLSQQRLKKRFGLPSKSRFLGFVINLPESDEYLASYESTGFVDTWGWVMGPYLAKKFKHLKQAQKVIQEYDKNIALICYLFDTPESYRVIRISN